MAKAGFWKWIEEKILICRFACLAGAPSRYIHDSVGDAANLLI